ncbi:MAG: NAD(P)-dependent oxidoreductase [Acidobacteriota bacterium]
MSAEYLMGLDLGSSGVRCLIVRPDGSVIGSGARGWRPAPAREVGPLCFTMDLDEIRRILGQVVREAMGRSAIQATDIAGLACAAMRFSFILIDCDGKELVAIPNLDVRASAEYLEIAREHGQMFHGRTGHWPLPIFAAVRLLHLSRSAPELLSKATAFLTLGDWVGLRLTGRIATDPTHAAETMTFDIERREWAWDLVDMLALPRAIFPDVLGAGAILGSLTAEAAEWLGLRQGTPVAVGCADTQSALLGAGAIEPGDLAVVAGSSTPVQLVLDAPFIDREARAWTGCHAAPDKVVLESTAGTMGDALDAAARVLYPDSRNPVSRLLAEASLAIAGSGGVISSFGTSVMCASRMTLPAGNISLSHFALAGGGQDRGCIPRAILEGMAFAVRANADQLRRIRTFDSERVRLAGGLARNALWNQLVSDVLGQSLAVSTQCDSSALGACICAGVAGQVFDSVRSGVQALARTCDVQPHAERVRLYRDRYDEWLRMRDAQTEPDQIFADSVLRRMSVAPRSVPARTAKKPHLRILVTAELDQGALSELRALGEVTYSSYREELRVLTGDALVEALKGFQVLVTEADIVDAAALEQLPDLRVVAVCRNDVVNVDLSACTRSGIVVFNTPGRNAAAVADLTVLFLLMLARRMPRAAAFLKEHGGEAGDHGRMGMAHLELQGREPGRTVVGLVGFGWVGRAVARRLTGFDTRVLVHDPYVDPAEIFMADAAPADLDTLLSESDFVSLHAPLTAETTGMLDGARLARMKRGASLINTARAGLVDTAALIDALRSGHLAGAAVDVFEEEPPASDHPLLAIPNVIATPHIGGNTVEVASHQGRIVADALRAIVAGEKPRCVLNPETLGDLRWDAARTGRPAEDLGADSRGPALDVTDLQRAGRPSDPSSKVSATELAKGQPVAGPPPIESVKPVVGQMERIIRSFVNRIGADARLRAFAARNTVISHYVLSDLGTEFHFGFEHGAVIGGLGPPGRPADVRLRATAEILDGVLSGKLSGARMAVTGKLAFSGNIRLAMSMQRISSEVMEAYNLARDEAGGIEFGPEAAPAREAPAVVRREPAGADDPRAAIVEVVRELFDAGMITPTGGNVSTRAPDGGELWITPSQLYKGRLGPELMVRIDLDGVPVDPDAWAPSSEWMLHCDIYKARPDVHSVIHAHAPYATMLVLADLPFSPVTCEAALFGDLPRVPFVFPGTPELARSVVAALGKGRAVLLQNHGVVVASSSLRQAANEVEMIERASQLIVGCAMAGKKPVRMPKEHLEMMREIGGLMG